MALPPARADLGGARTARVFIGMGMAGGEINPRAELTLPRYGFGFDFDLDRGGKKKRSSWRVDEGRRGEFLVVVGGDRYAIAW